MKVVIVFHSVCGNTYLMAKAFEEGLKELKHDVRVYRVADADWVEKDDVSEKAKENLVAMRSLPEAKPQVLVEADIVILGSPTYFGNVTAEMKTFMDATGLLWVQGKLIGKKFVAYASAGNTEGGGDLCLQALQTYGKYMGMVCLPMPVSVLPGENVPALGAIQYSNGKYAEALDAKTSRMVRHYCAFLSKSA